MISSNDTPVKYYSEMRVQMMSAIDYFYVTGPPVPFDQLDTVLDPLLENLYEAKKLANLGETGPDITRYYKIENGLFVMEVGIPVKPGVASTGKAQIKRLPPFYCAGILLWGSLAHIAEVYQKLSQRMEEQKLEYSYETREWVYYFEAPDSEQNLMGIYKGIKSQR